MTPAISGRNSVSRSQTKPRFTTREGASYQCALADRPTAWDMWLGRIRKHSTRLASRTTITVKGMSLMRSPKRPPMMTRPQKAITVVSVAQNTGSAMRRAAVSAAFTGSMPRCARWSACSPTTMASSTTIPSVMISAKSEIILSVMPKAYISASAASIATGIPAATQKAVRALRNRNSSTSTRPRPVSPLSSRMSSRPLIASARVRIRSISTPSGSPASKSRATSSTVRWMPMASPRSLRSTRIEMARFSPTK